VTDLLFLSAALFEFVALVALLLVFGRFALKTRLVNSLQFQLFVFLLVLVIAEIPRALWNVGLMDQYVYFQFGLPLHAFSMVLLAVFVVFRFVRGSLR
jgi:hypothetical protein